MVWPGHEASTAEYVQRGRVFLEQAEEEVRREDLRQASEKGWDAASQLINAAANEYGMEHDRRGRLYQVAGRLATTHDEQDLRDWFGFAGEFHSNFYEGFMNQGDAELHLAEVIQFVDRVEGILCNGSTTRS